MWLARRTRSISVALSTRNSRAAKRHLSAGPSGTAQQTLLPHGLAASCFWRSGNAFITFRNAIECITDQPSFIVV